MPKSCSTCMRPARKLGPCWHPTGSTSLTIPRARKGRRRTAVTTDQLVHTLLGGLAIGCIYSLIALGITMIIRATEILHFAQGEMMMIGSMVGLSAYWLLVITFFLRLIFWILRRGI